MHIDTLQLGPTEATITYINPSIEACFHLTERFATMPIEPPPVVITYNEHVEKVMMPPTYAINRPDQTNPVMHFTTYFYTYFSTLTYAIHVQKGSSTCLPSISDIEKGQNRTWFHTSCSRCKRVLAIFCLEHRTVANPSYKNRFTATITDVNDNIMTTKAVFFDETVSSMTNVNCYTIVINHKNSNPHILPPIAARCNQQTVQFFISSPAPKATTTQSLLAKSFYLHRL